MVKRTQASLSVFDHFAGLVLKGLRITKLVFKTYYVELDLQI